MNTSRLLTAAAATAAAGVAGLMGAAVASADDHGATVQNLGQQGQLVDGANIQGWTVGNLQPSADVIPYRPGGTLWEATATDQAIAGGAVPFVPNFSARAANGDDYRALFEVPTPQGVNPSGLAQGQATTGKLYFDVTGAVPNSVVYGSGGQDQLIWVEPPPSAEGTTGGYSSAGQSGYSGQSTPVPSGTGTSTAMPATAPAATGQSATSAPAAAAPAAAAADDVHGAATAAQPKPTTAPLDVHDTTVAPTTTPSGSAPAPAASSGSSQTATAAPSPAAASAVPTTVPPAAPVTAGTASS